LGGLLKSSFIQPRDIRDLRDIVRYRKKQDQQIHAENNRIYKILEDANIKLSTFIKADSVSGKKIINAIIDGETNVDRLMKFVNEKVKASRSEIRKALESNLSVHHRFILKVIRKSIETKEMLLAELDFQIDEMVKDYSQEVDLLTTIDGVGRISAIAIISEIGTDMSRFPNEHHLSSLGGMSPGNNESAGKIKFKNHQSEQTSQGNISWMWMGGIPKKRRISQAKVLQHCRTQG